MRLLQVSHHFPPRHRAGVEIYTERIARALQARGHEVAVLATDDDPLREPFSLQRREHGGLEVFEIAHPRVVRRPEDTLQMPGALSAFERALEIFEPDLVHFQHVMYVGLDAPRRVRERGLPALLTLQEYWLLCPRDGHFLMGDGTRCLRAEPATCGRCLSDGFRLGRSPGEQRVARAAERVRRWTGWDPFPRLKRLRQRGAPDGAAGQLPPAAPDAMLRFLAERETRVRALLDHIDVILAPSRFLGTRFTEAGIPEERIRWWPYGLDLGPFAAAFAENCDPEGPLRVGFVGSIVPKKGVDVLARAQRLLPRGRCRLQIHGRVDFLPLYGATLRRLAVAGECAFPGGFDPEDAPRIMAGLDVLVVPSVWYENAPIVISEAFAAGVPVVASRLGGMAEMVRDGVDGRLFEPGNPEDLARVLRDVIEDPDELPRLRAGVRPPRSIEDDAAGLESLYAELRGARA